MAKTNNIFKFVNHEQKEGKQKKTHIASLPHLIDSLCHGRNHALSLGRNRIEDLELVAVHFNLKTPNLSEITLDCGW